jgi:hypothetical protein
MIEILKGLAELHRACTAVSFTDEDQELWRVHLATVTVNALEHARNSGYIQHPTIFEIVEKVLRKGRT